MVDSDHQFAHKHILSIEDLSASDIEYILLTADSFKEISSRSIKKVPTLRGKTVINLFFEPSTRTRLSFEIAAKRLSADTFNISASTSSITKGETLIDTARNLEAMNPDVIIMRHAYAGSPRLLADLQGASIINAGDGSHEHPTQALLDMMTVREKKNRLDGLKVAIIGDISHSRVAHSNILGFTKMGATVHVSGPKTLIPKDIASLGAIPCQTVQQAVEDADVVMTLRLQKERQREPFIPSMREYASFYGISQKVLEWAKPDALIMHPGPVNQGVEMEPSVVDHARSVILEQVTNGVAVRMALLYLILGGER